MTKRAIALGGGGPLVGVHLGVLRRFAEAGLTFDTWALSCIGAWAGVIYNAAEGDPVQKAQHAHKYFRQVFRDDAGYASFPLNTAFPPDPRANLVALVDFVANAENYRNLIVPQEIRRFMRASMAMLRKRTYWNEGDRNRLLLQALAANPLVRFMTAMVYKCNRSGLTKMFYPPSSLLGSINFEALYDSDAPFVYHNAWNLSKSRMELFANHSKVGMGHLDARSLCACSALPFIEDTVEINGDIYCEGALVSTINLTQLFEDFDLDEVWVVRLVDVRQAKPHSNLYEALGNLMMLFAGSLGESDIELFRHRAEKAGWEGKIIEVDVSTEVNFDWSHSNLELGVREGYAAASAVL